MYTQGRSPFHRVGPLLGGIGLSLSCSERGVLKDPPAPIRTPTM